MCRTLVVGRFPFDGLSKRIYMGLNSLVWSQSSELGLEVELILKLIKEDIGSIETLWDSILQQIFSMENRVSMSGYPNNGKRNYQKWFEEE